MSMMNCSHPLPDGRPAMSCRFRGRVLALALVVGLGLAAPAWPQDADEEEDVAAEEAAAEEAAAEEAAAEEVVDDSSTPEEQGQDDATQDEEIAADAVADDAADDALDDQEASQQADTEATTDDEDDVADAGAEVLADDTDDDALADENGVFADGSTVNDEFMSADWAPDVTSDPADDAVPVDVTLDPAGLGWEVVPVETTASGSGRGAANAAAVSDVAGGAGILRMRPRTSASARPQPGSAGARPAARPGAGNDGKDTAYSFGGQPIKPGSAPWQAQIYRSAAKEQPGVPRWKAQHNCGGTLIAPNWILTAAHCIDDILGDREAGWRVRLGGQDLSKEDGVTYVVDRWVRHSGYKNVAHPDPPKAPVPPPNMYANDIGLIHIRADAQTRPPADPKRVQPISLFRKPIGGGDEVTAIGWGMTENVAKSFSAVPLKIDLRVMDTPECQARAGYGPQRVNSGVICAAREGQKTCRGDSGGPVILTNGTTAQLVGIVSWGKRDCSGDGRPSVFTRVESYLPWIEQAMKLPETRATLP
jgi:hypothetical protein